MRFETIINTWSMASDEQKRRLLKAKIAVALRDELGRVPTSKEIEQVFLLTRVMYKAVLGLHYRRKEQRPRRRLPPAEAAGRVLLRRQPGDQPGGDRAAGHLRLGESRPPAVLDRRLRHRENTSAHRARHPRRRGRLPGPLHAGGKLVNELVEAADDKQLTKLINRYGRVDLILVDELGYLQLDRRGAELLFQVLTEREERSAIAIASNEPFSSRTKTFTDPRLCAAIVDRLTFAGQIIETGS